MLSKKQFLFLAALGLTLTFVAEPTRLAIGRTVAAICCKAGERLREQGSRVAKEFVQFVRENAESPEQPKPPTIEAKLILPETGFSVTEPQISVEVK